MVLYFTDLRARLEDAPRGKRYELIEQAARFLGRSEDWVYERLREVGWRSGRRRRKDSGRSKLGRKECAVLASMLTASTRSTRKRLLSARSAIEIAQANGALGAAFSSATAMRRLREEGMHPRLVARATPHVRRRSLHPNHVWQFDVSVCVLYYLSKGGLSVMNRREFYKNKPGSFARIANERVLRYVVTDHYSGAFYLRYYLGAGESSELAFNFLIEAFTRREHPKDPFHGVPFMLVWDAGSANQSHLVRNALDQLGVEHWAHRVGNPRAKGQNECTQNIVERDFEGRLVFENIEDLEALNAKAHIWMRQMNGARTHTRHGHTRYGLWQTIRPEQLRICPPRALCERLLTTKPEPRTVRGNLVVQYAVEGHGPREYSVAAVPGVRVGERVNVCVNPYRAPNILVIAPDAEGRTHYYECAPIETDAAGFPLDAPVFGESYGRLPDTDIDRNRKGLAKLTYGVETEAELDEARRKRVPAFGGRIDAFSYLEERTPASYMERPGRALEVPGTYVVKREPLNLVSAAKRLMARIGDRWSPECYAWLRARYPEGVPEEKLEAIARTLGGEQLPERGAGGPAG